MKKALLWGLCAAILAGGGIWYAAWRRDLSKPDTRLDTTKVQRGNIKLSILTTGSARPQNRLEIKSPVAGRVEQVLVKEGDHMKTGQIMAWLSSTERAALLDAARSKGEAVLASWEELYKPTPLIAPLDGDIIARNMEPGQTVTAQDVLLVMSNRLIVEAQLDETDIARVSIGQRAEIALDSYPDERILGSVDHIAFEAKTVNNVTMYMVDVLPDTIPSFLRSGMTANISLIMAETNNVLILPSDCVIESGGRSFLLVPSHDAKTQRIEVETGLSDGKNTEIKSGVLEGEVVTRKAFSLSGNSAENAPRNPFMPARPRRR